jgi:uncharacterized YigZ family protein
MFEYKTVVNLSKFEFKEKHSKFLSFCKNVCTEKEAACFLENIKFNHRRAKHHVYAYKIFENPNLPDCNKILSKYSDDGEPTGTAGIQVLNAIESAGLQNIIIVVTRYFGGVLLGTGKLSRAYKHAAESVTAAAETIIRKLYLIVEFNINYSEFGKIQNIINNCFIIIIEIKYNLNVMVKIAVREVYFEKFKNLISEKIGRETKFRLIGNKYC